MDPNIEESKNNSTINNEEPEEKVNKSIFVEEEEGVKHNWSGRHYIMLAIGAGLLFGTTNFLYEYKISSVSTDFYLVLYLPIFFGQLLLGVLYHMQRLMVNKKKYGQYWMPEHSPYIQINEITVTQSLLNESKDSRQADQGKLISIEQPQLTTQTEQEAKLNKFNFYGMIARGFCQMLQYFVHIAVLYFTTLSGTNLSLILNLYSLSPFLTAIAFYFIFKETLTRYHIIGMILVVLSAVMIGVSNYTGSDDDDDSLTVLIPVAFAIVSTFFIASTATVSKYVVTNGSISSIQIIADSSILCGIVYMIVFFCVQDPYPISDILFMGGSSVIATLGYYLINEAYVNGKGGPSQALCEFQSLWLLTLEVLFLDKDPTTMQIFAFVIGIFGGLFIAANAFTCFKKQSNLQQ